MVGSLTLSTFQEEGNRSVGWMHVGNLFKILTRFVHKGEEDDEAELGNPGLRLG